MPAITATDSSTRVVRAGSGRSSCSDTSEPGGLRLAAAGEAAAGERGLALGGRAEQLVDLVGAVAAGAVVVVEAGQAAAVLGDVAQAARAGMRRRLVGLPLLTGAAPAVGDGQQLVALPRAVGGAHPPGARRTQTGHSVPRAPLKPRPLRRGRGSGRAAPGAPAIWTPFRAAPLRRLSATTQRASPLGRDAGPGGSGRPAPGRGRRRRWPSGSGRSRGRRRRSRPGAAARSSRASSGVSGRSVSIQDRLGVRPPDRDAHAGGADADRVVVHDLVRLADQLASPRWSRRRRTHRIGEAR